MATPNMNLSLPTVSVTVGPTYGAENNTAFTDIDAHDHTSGKGVQVPSSGLNINADLDFQSNRADSLLSTKFTSQVSTLTGASNANSVYVVSGDLYYTNSGGSAIQLTSGASLAAIPGASIKYETQPVTSNLVILVSDTFSYLEVDTSTPRSITLPLASGVDAGRFYIVKDITGSSNTNAITVNRSGSDTIDGDTSQTLDSDYGSWIFVSDGTSAWRIS